MQFERDEYVLLSRLGRVPQARSKGPPRYEPVVDRQARANGRRRNRRSLARALRTTLRVGRPAVGAGAQPRGDR